jgi:hypothetical protein
VNLGSVHRFGIEIQLERSDDEYGEARNKWMDEQIKQWLEKILILRGRRPILIEQRLSLCIWDEKWQCAARAIHE